jgi:hypothetical protein
MRVTPSPAIAIGTIGFLTLTAHADRIKLGGTWTAGQIDMRCADAGGTVTSGTGSGGYGCKTAVGEVSCTSGGKCTGSCSNCKSIVIRTGVDGVLRGRSVGAR